VKKNTQKHTEKKLNEQAAVHSCKNCSLECAL